MTNTRLTLFINKPVTACIVYLKIANKFKNISYFSISSYHHSQLDSFSSIKSTDRPLHRTTTTTTFNAALCETFAKSESESSDAREAIYRSEC